jgi:hypothetical protein
LLVDSGEQAHLGNKSQFSFELSWLREDGFQELIEAEWGAYIKGNSPIEIWQNKIRHLRRFLKGWAKHKSGVYRKEKERLMQLIDQLDIKAESGALGDAERVSLRHANHKLCKLRRDEEAKWAQRAKVKHVQEGGNNTKYFHLIANGKHRKKKIYQLEQDEGTIVGEENFKVYITEYYKRLFGDPVKNSFSMNEGEVSHIPQVSPDENSILTAAFSEE